jgi:hypothetical protein
MRLVSRSGLIATALAIGAIVAPGAQAGGLLSGPGVDPPGAARQEAQSFQRIYGVARSNSVPVSRPTASAPGDGFDYGDAAVGVGIAGGVALLVTAGTISIRHQARVRHP